MHAFTLCNSDQSSWYFDFLYLCLLSKGGAVPLNAIFGGKRRKRLKNESRGFVGARERDDGAHLRSDFERRSLRRLFSVNDGVPASGETRG